MSPFCLNINLIPLNMGKEHCVGGRDGARWVIGNTNATAFYMSVKVNRASASINM
uniref:Uncharacterized protein n=1 Tax=Moniliophthora roreri TaxID=221103 RepID=A0A0W0FAQ2_MONRR